MLMTTVRWQKTCSYALPGSERSETDAGKGDSSEDFAFNKLEGGLQCCKLLFLLPDV